MRRLQILVILHRHADFNLLHDRPGEGQGMLRLLEKLRKSRRAVEYFVAPAIHQDGAENASAAAPGAAHFVRKSASVAFVAGEGDDSFDVHLPRHEQWRL